MLLSNLYHSYQNEYLDTNRVALFSKSDAPIIKKLLQEQHFDNFNERLDRFLNDQTSYDDLHHKHLEPLQVRIKHDLVVTTGMQRIAKLVTGKTTTSFTHMACGTGTSAESSGDQSLQAETQRIACTDRFDSGTSIKFAGLFPSSTPTGQISEFGIFDSPAAGNMLVRTVFSPAISHVQDSTIFSLTQVISQSSS